MLGLSVANILGVPLATWVGQLLGWNAAFVLVAAAALTTAGLARLCLPPMPAHALASPRRELGGLRQLSVPPAFSSDRAVENSPVWRGGGPFVSSALWGAARR